MASLPGFQLVALDNDYTRLYRFLWQAPTPNSPAVSGLLTDYINEWSDEEELDEPRPHLRFIDLDLHPYLRIHTLLKPHPSKVVIRDEYVEFMRHALAAGDDELLRFFLTGQPGIGKSVGACYFLFCLLASGQPGFFIPEPDTVYYFSEHGVQKGSDSSIYRNSLTVREAVELSWVLIDVDIGNSPASLDWYPREWLKPCKTMIWTSSPRDGRLRHFKKHFRATPWYMKPWSLAEIDSLCQLAKKDNTEIRARLELSGPVARSLFFDVHRTMIVDIDSVIRRSLVRGLFEFATSTEGNDEGASHRMYLLRPLETYNEDGVLQISREVPMYSLLSSCVAARAVELSGTLDDIFRARLASAFDHPPTRGAAGKLVESILHQALRRRSVDPFGVGPGLFELRLIGEAATFIIETAPRPTPVYLRPLSQTFAAIDAIVVTDTTLWLIQSTVADSHSFVFKTLLAVLLRLEKKGYNVKNRRLVYCPIGTDEGRVKTVARSAARKLNALKGVTPEDRTLELGQVLKESNWFVESLQVEGYYFVALEELTRVWPLES
ncbi:hypothetical protein B0H16DRAFT_958741 [Mycena metata]|uniref:Uncharacterized protein n=1 Tax=Mycena metata TaxID=1033252 RepID=A0AAD7NW40_9AGAR|nr:hypothetical protein B0H16DRAFT_958741 [Mycena metata]